LKYDKQDQQGKAAFNERNPHMTQQQEPMARSPGGPHFSVICYAAKRHVGLGWQSNDTQLRLPLATNPHQQCWILVLLIKSYGCSACAEAIYSFLAGHKVLRFKFFIMYSCCLFLPPLLYQL
jgi:hypothetical protein